MKVTVCQMNDDPGEFETDWGLLGRHMKKAKSEIVLLPEMPFYPWFATQPAFDPRVWKEAVSAHGRWMGRLDELGASVVLGSRPVDVGDRRLNQAFVWNRKGGVKGVHFKSYLPDEPGFYEGSWYNRGDREFRPFGVAGLRAGFMVCSELWSMKHAREYGKEGVDLLAVPRATPRASIEKWAAGGKVAAVISGAYCLSSNRAGKAANVEFGGVGWVVDPEGEVLGLTSKEEPFVSVEIDPRAAREAKKTYPRDSLRPD
jgi:N-carbamoylputrescine amidase